MPDAGPTCFYGNHPLSFLMPETSSPPFGKDIYRLSRRRAGMTEVVMYIYRRLRSPLRSDTPTSETPSFPTVEYGTSATTVYGAFPYLSKKKDPPGTGKEAGRKQVAAGSKLDGRGAEGQGRRGEVAQQGEREQAAGRAEGDARDSRREAAGCTNKAIGRLGNSSIGERPGGSPGDGSSEPMGTDR